MIKIKRPRREIPREVPAVEREREREVYYPDSALGAILAPKALSVKKNRPRKTRFAFWGVAIVSVLFFIFALSYLFSKVTVTVLPKIKEVVLSESMTASRSASGEDLPFDLVVISGEESRTVRATEEKDFSKRAEGTVLIYNAFGYGNQLLSIDTRLEGSNGRIYKTKKQIYVPGMKGSTLGSIEVGIYAAEAGEEYNSDPLDFKIFGFKGTPKYTKFYARSKGPIAGGFKGKAPYISDTEKGKVMGELKTALQAKLVKKATDQIPSGFILFKDAVFLDMEDGALDVPAAGLTNTFPVKVVGTLYGILFDEKKLTQKIVKDKIKEYDRSPVYLSGIKNATFSLSSPSGKSAATLADVKNIDFKLSGKAQVVWKVDENELALDLLGKAKKDFRKILLSYPNIASADLLISPFWKRSLPDKKKDIEIIVNYPK